MIFVCCGFWFAVLFQFFYYRFLHPSYHVRLSTKQNLSSIVNIRPLARVDRPKRSKSCEEMIGQNDQQNTNENHELIETTSLHLDPSNDERWHNRFSFANRQKLISQQQAIDQKVKLTRLEEEAAKRQHQTMSQRFLMKISTTLKRPTTISTSLVTQSLDNPSEHQQSISLPPRISEPTRSSREDEHVDKSSIPYGSNRRTSHYQKQSKMYDIDEDTQLNDEKSSSNPTTIHSQGGKDVLLTTTKLTPVQMMKSSSNPTLHNQTCSSTTNTSLC